MSYYDKSGKPMELMEWSKKVEDAEYRIVGYCNIGPYRISTCWMGLDYNFFGGPPLIFETMIFEGNKCSFDYQERYTTLEQAIKGHQTAMDFVRCQMEERAKDSQSEDPDQSP